MVMSSEKLTCLHADGDDRLRLPKSTIKVLPLSLAAASDMMSNNIALALRWEIVLT